MVSGEPKEMIIYLVKKEMICWEVVSGRLVKVSMVVVVYLPALAAGDSGQTKINLPL